MLHTGNIHIYYIYIYFAYSWYFGEIPRREAEKWLLITGNPSGTFLVRTSSSQKNSLSLSLRDGDGIKHYRIRRLDNGCYFIASRCTFQTVRVSQQLSLWGYTCLLRHTQKESVTEVQTRV